MSNIDRFCLNCGVKFKARVCDVKRSWAKFHNKSCKAKYQEKHTGQYANYLYQSNERDDGSGCEQD